MTFLDICSGIGGFRSGLEKSGMTCIGWVEIDENARKSYQAMYDTKREWTATDITQLDSKDIPKADLWCFGFPCQDISVAGSRRGLKGSRSGIFYSIIKHLKSKRTEDKPHWLLIENVKNLLSINGGWDYTEVLSEISEAGYDCHWELLNSKDFGVPQNRERVFIIGRLRERGGFEVLPLSGAGGKIDTNGEERTIRKIINGKHETDDVVGTDGISKSLKATDYKNPQKTAVPVLTPDRKNKRQNGRRFKENNEPMFTLTAQDRHGVMVFEGKGYYIRKLTPRECFRLQGFTDEQFERAEAVCSDAQLYKQAGNAVTVNVAEVAGRYILDLSEGSLTDEKKTEGKS